VPPGALLVVRPGAKALVPEWPTGPEAFDVDGRALPKLLRPEWPGAPDPEMPCLLARSAARLAPAVRAADELDPARLVLECPVLRPADALPPLLLAPPTLMLVSPWW
jgi:hypothetical protein